MLAYDTRLGGYIADIDRSRLHIDLGRICLDSDAPSVPCAALRWGAYSRPFLEYL
jgi:hypothetical protein